MAPSPYRSRWLLADDVIFLNHGSFGATPAAVLERQSELRHRMEREPVQFFVRELEGLLDCARESLARFLGASPEDLVFVRNVTEGVNSVLASLSFGPGDELLTTSHEYNASRNALVRAADQWGANVVVARVPFPAPGEDELVEPVLDALTERTRLVLIDHVTSPTGLVFPLERIVREVRARGVDVLVDGAHAPGMVPLDLDSLGATFYSANCHKWLCAPKGAGFLWVERARRSQIRPAITSHGANSTRTDRSRFHLEFDWTGTDDPTPFLCVPESITALEQMVVGGWPAIRAHNHRLAIEGRDTLCKALGIAAPAPSELIGSIASVPLPPSRGGSSTNSFGLDPIQDALYERHRIEVPVFQWPDSSSRLLRISAQLYNTGEDYEALAQALMAELERGS